MDIHWKRLIIDPLQWKNWNTTMGASNKVGSRADLDKWVGIIEGMIKGDTRHSVAKVFGVHESHVRMIYGKYKRGDLDDVLGEMVNA